MKRCVDGRYREGSRIFYSAALEDDSTAICQSGRKWSNHGRTGPLHDYRHLDTAFLMAAKSFVGHDVPIVLSRVYNKCGMGGTCQHTLEKITFGQTYPPTDVYKVCFSDGH